MFVYKDYQYIRYVLNSPYNVGFDLYIKCINRINIETEKDLENKLWLAYINSSETCTFNEFKEKSIKKQPIITNKNADEKEILTRTEELRRKFDEIDKNKINEVIVR